MNGRKLLFVDLKIVEILAISSPTKYYYYSHLNTKETVTQEV